MGNGHVRALTTVTYCTFTYLMFASDAVAHLMLMTTVRWRKSPQYVYVRFHLPPCAVCFPCDEKSPRRDLQCFICLHKSTCTLRWITIKEMFELFIPRKHALVHLLRPDPEEFRRQSRDSVGFSWGVKVDHIHYLGTAGTKEVWPQEWLCLNIADSFAHI